MKINFKKNKELFIKLPRILAGNSFFASLSFIFLALLIGAIMYYKYSILVKKIEPQINEVSLQFQEKTYQEILTEWQKREERFKAADSKQYLNPFKTTTSAAELTK